MITLLQLRPYTGDRVAPSPNHGARHVPRIQGIVLHATADDGNEALALAWLRSPASRVSCHLMVSRGGRVTRLVGDRQRAWHAGDAWWRGTTDVNSITLGIEIANRNDGEPYTAAQYSRVAAIVAHYCRQGLALDDVVGHEAIAPGRKTDPFGWDWERFRNMVRRQQQDRARTVVAPTSQPKPNKEVARDVRAASPKVVAPAKPIPPPKPVAPPKQRAPVLTMPKPVMYSRTLWLAGMTVLASGGMLVGETVDFAHRIGITPPEVLAKWALFLVGIVNIILRLRTTQPLTCSPVINRSLAEARLQLREQARGGDSQCARTGRQQAGLTGGVAWPTGSQG